MNVLIQYLKYVGVVSIPFLVITVMVITAHLAITNNAWFWALFVFEGVLIGSFIFWATDSNSRDPLFPYKEYNFKKRNKGDKKNEEKDN